MRFPVFSDDLSGVEVRSRFPSWFGVAFPFDEVGAIVGRAAMIENGLDFVG